MSHDGSIRILVMEDDPAYQHVLRRRLAAEGFHLAVANDGREGMKMIVSFDPHLVLSDWMMPYVDGLELCQAIKTGFHDDAPYYILLTAKGEVSDRLLALETGADDYLVKPCDQGEILARVKAGTRMVMLARQLRHSEAENAALKFQLDEREAEIARLRRQTDGCPRCGARVSACSKCEARAA